MIRLILCFLIVSLGLFLISCSEKSDPSLDRQNFSKIFDNNQFDSAYYAIDIKETSDNGYLIVARKKTGGELSGTYILKADVYGNFVSDLALGTELSNPVGELMQQGDVFYFFCMDAATKYTRLLAIDHSGQLLSNNIVDVTYPCATSLDGNGFMLLSYDHVEKYMVLTGVSAAGEIDFTKAAAFSVGVGGEDEVYEDMINHFFQYGQRLPFITGKTPEGTYYFNGFFNYTFSLVFTDFSSVNGVVQGQHENGGISAVLPLGNGRFAASVFNFGDNYILPNRDLDISTLSTAVELGGFTLPELVADAEIRILKAKVNERDVIIFAGNTKSKQIGLWFYDENTGELLHSMRLGYSNPYEIGNLTQTSDGGLAVCATTYIAGRFPRVSLFKLSKAQINF